jgi:Pyridoxamine 5'-phosphate oxidase
MSHLQAALDRSLRNASPFTRSLFEDDTLDAAGVARLINSVRNLTVSTVTGAGEPHAAVVIAACIDGDIHFTVSDESVLQRNLARRPRVAFTACDRTHTLMGRGDAVLAARALDDPDLIARLASASDSGSFTPVGWDGSVYRLEIDRIFAS